MVAPPSVTNSSITTSHLAKIMFIYPESFDLDPIQIIVDGDRVSSITVDFKKDTVKEGENHLSTINDTIMSHDRDAYVRLRTFCERLVAVV